MRYTTILAGLIAICVLGSDAALWNIAPVLNAQITSTPLEPDLTPSNPDAPLAAVPTEQGANDHTWARFQADLEAVTRFRPAYNFWQHIFTIPDGRIIFGSAEDGELVVTFPSSGNWARNGTWEDPQLSSLLDNQPLQRRLSRRRAQVEDLLEPLIGPVVHNPTRGLVLLRNVELYGGFLSEWATIYERFGVPAEIGLAQAILESGLNGRARSPARALGFCQWLTRNWAHLNRLAPNVIEAYNQTTQAPYCAAYLSILATMYGSFIPALSEHHAGGVNVGRTVVNGERLGGQGTREQYLLGAEFARDLRDISIYRYRELFRTYGPRSFLYAEMVFGNTLTVPKLISEHPQEQIFAMRAPRNLPLSEITRRSGLSSTEAKRFNPALVRQVPARANVYLPSYISEFGPDFSFWHRSADPEFAVVLNDFVRLEASVQQWHEPSFDSTLRIFQQRFAQTGSEEGTIMATTLAYVLDNLRSSRRAAILEEFRSSQRIERLFQQGVRELSMPVSSRTPQEHVVQRGETLTQIAARYGQSVGALVAVNNLSSPNRIQVGTRLSLQDVREPSMQVSSGTPQVHVVQRGETLTQIAARYGQSVGALVAVNNLSSPNRIQVGARLLLARTPQVHIVQRGETLSQIAARYGQSVRAIVAINNLGSPNRIQIGARLSIPGLALE